MDAVPEAIPVTTPVEDTVPTDVLLLLQVPPAGVDERVVVVPAQMLVLPVMADGMDTTVTIADDRHPPVT